MDKYQEHIQKKKSQLVKLKKEEEKIREMIALVQDQKSRLSVERLEILSKIRENQPKEPIVETRDIDIEPNVLGENLSDDVNQTHTLDLNSDHKSILEKMVTGQFAVEEEEEDDDEL